jgi:Fic family protein
MIRYELPRRWILYDANTVMTALVEAKAAVRTLTTLPYQKSWVAALEELQLKREVAGSCRMEGAEFTERELDQALRPGVAPEELHTRSQRQALAAAQTYRWLGELPAEEPITAEIVREVHRLLVTGCDDDHCPAGVLRGRYYNVTFGTPQHRGAEGGAACEEAFAGLLQAAEGEYREHDLLVQAVALHYHLAAMHPFQDGNGRLARALESLLLRRAGLTGWAFVAMSNYYYDEKPANLRILGEVWHGNHDLTPFLIFALRGVRIQCERLMEEMRRQMQRVLFRDTMYSLYSRLETKRKRMVGERQMEILKLLLEAGQQPTFDCYLRMKPRYGSVKDGMGAFLRDLSQLEGLKAIHIFRNSPELAIELASINMKWPQEIDEGEFLRQMKAISKGKTTGFLS